MGSFKSRATDVEAVILSADAVSDFGASTYGFLAYTAADPDAIMIQIRTLISKPEILFADEPTGNLDSKTGAEIMNLLQEINQSIGQTIIMVTQFSGGREDQQPSDYCGGRHDPLGHPRSRRQRWRMPSGIDKTNLNRYDTIG